MIHYLDYLGWMFVFFGHMIKYCDTLKITSQLYNDSFNRTIIIHMKTSDD